MVRFEYWGRRAQDDDISCMCDSGFLFGTNDRINWRKKWLVRASTRERFVHSTIANYSIVR